MSNLDEGNAFLYNVSVCTLMCGCYEATKDYIHECQNTMRILHFVVWVLQSNKR